MLIGQITSSSNTNTSVYASCPSTGSFAFSIYLNGNAAATDTFYVTIVNTQVEWYSVIYNATSQSQNTFLYPNQSGYQFRLWLVDPTNLGTNEASKTALVPSTSSSHLSMAFQNLGFVPTLQYQSLYASLGSISWNQNANYWECQLNSSSNGSLGSFSISFHEQGISVMGLSVNPSSTLIPIQKYTSTPFDPSTISSSIPGPLNIYSDVCASGIHFATSSLFGNSNLAYTQNDFNSLDNTLNSIYQIPSSTAFINGVSSTKETIAVLVGNKVSYGSQGNTLLTTSTGIPATETSIDRIQGPHYCDPRSKKSSLTNSLVLAWSSTTTSPTISLYLSYTGGSSFINVPVSTDISSTNNGGKIYAVTMDHSRATICVLLRDANTSDRILLIDALNPVNSSLGYTSGSNPSVLDGGGKGSVPSLRAFPGGQLLVWGDSLNYSPDGGKTLFPVALNSRNPIMPASGLGSLEYILDVVGSNDGKFAVLTSTNRVFYGMLGVATTLELNAGIATSANVKLIFDSLSNLFVITPQTTAPFLSRRLIHVPNEIKSPRVPSASNNELKCPYSLWTSLKPSSSITLDIGDRITIPSYLVSSASISNSVSVSLTNTSVVSQSLDRSYPPENLDIVYIENTTISLTPQSYLSKGRVDVIIQPNNENLACAKSQEIVEILADCPPTRTLVFYVPPPHTHEPSPTPRHHKNRYTSKNSQYGKTSAKATATPTLPSSTNCIDTPFTIPSGQWYNRNTSSMGTTSQTITNFCANYGTPATVYYGLSYRPSFAIFDNGIFVKTVDADIGMIEVNGRTSYSFNATSNSEKCVSDPVSLKLGSFPSLYSPCYSVPGSLTNPSKEYEIMNRTNGNAITWNGYMNGIYLFQAKVLDPNFSYCSLTTKFAVNVVGAPSDIGWQILIIGLVDLFGLIGLIGSYFWYSSSRKGLRTEEFEKLSKDKVDVKKSKLE